MPRHGRAHTRCVTQAVSGPKRRENSGECTRVCWVKQRRSPACPCVPPACLTWRCCCPTRQVAPRGGEERPGVRQAAGSGLRRLRERRLWHRAPRARLHCWCAGAAARALGDQPGSAPWWALRSPHVWLSIRRKRMERTEGLGSGLLLHQATGRQPGGLPSALCQVSTVSPSPLCPLPLLQVWQPTCRPRWRAPS